MPTAAQRAKAEAKAILQDDGSALVPLQGETLTVIPPADWRSAEIHAVRVNDYEVWAAGCLKPASYLVWRQINPTFRQCEEFFEAWQNRTGQDVGESAAS